MSAAPRPAPHAAQRQVSFIAVAQLTITDQAWEAAIAAPCNEAAPSVVSLSGG